MAELIRSDRRSGQAAIASLVLMAALLAGIVGGLVGARLASVAGAQPVQAAANAASVDWAQYGTKWETQYRAMYPATVDTKWAAYGAKWETQYRAMNPTVLDPTLVKYGLDWQRQYEQQHPTTFRTKWPRHHPAGRVQ
jgi:hypothetical protein